MARYAVVCLVMRGDAYVPGALVTAFSARRADVHADLVCMVTDDVTPEARASLALVFDRVLRVPYIRAEAVPLPTAKQQSRYGAWMTDACTKWNLLAFEEYDKVLFLDADKLVLSSLDELFTLRAPAATFSSPWSHPFLDRRKSGNIALPNPYIGLQHGDRVPRSAIQQGLDSAYVAIGTTMLLRPSRRDLARLLELINADADDTVRNGVGLAPAPAAPTPAPAGDLRALIGQRRPAPWDAPADRDQAKWARTNGPDLRRRPPFGYPRCNSGTDEQAICCLYLDVRDDWTWIHQRHNYIPWHPRWIADTDAPPTVFHYFNTKPWQMRRTEWPDLEAWWLMADALVRTHPSLAIYFDAASLRADGGPAQPEAVTGAAGGPAQPAADTEAAGGQTRVEADAGAAGGQAQPAADTGAAGGQVQPEADTEAAGGQTRVEVDAGAAGGQAPPKADTEAASDQARAEADARAVSRQTCCWCTGAGKELARLRLERRAPAALPSGGAAPTPAPPHAIFDASGHLTCPALRPLQ